MARKHDRAAGPNRASRCSWCRAAPAVAVRVDRRDVTARVLPRVVWTPEIAIAWLKRQQRRKEIARRCHWERWLREHS